MKERLALIIATLGIGKYLKMSATTSGIVYAPLVYFFLFISKSTGFSILFYIFIFLLIFIFGIWSIPVTEKVLGSQIDPRGKIRERDHNAIVIDELLGFMITCIPFLFGVPQTLFNFVVAFLVFRFFDIFKKASFGAKYFDSMKNAYGVMLDDVVSGIYAGVTVYVLALFL